MDELHLTKKDFRLEWYSGSGSGGQHRNKHMNCCRITHTETGISAVGTESRSRVTNQKQAFARLAARLISHYTRPPYLEAQGGEHPGVASRSKMASREIRLYHAVRNEVKDHASGLRHSFKVVVTDGDLGPVIEARRKAL